MRTASTALLGLWLLALSFLGSALMVTSQVAAYRGDQAAAELMSRVVGKHSHSVVMFSTAWCPQCRRARRELRRANISFKEYDIEKSSYGRDVFARLEGEGVPLIIVRGRYPYPLYGVDMPRIRAVLADR